MPPKMHVDLFFETAARRKKLAAEINDGSHSSPNAHKAQNVLEDRVRVGLWKGKPTLRLGCSCLSEEEEEKKAKEGNSGSWEEKVAASGPITCPVLLHKPDQPTNAGIQIVTAPLAHEPLNRGVSLPTRPTEAAFPGSGIHR